MPRKKSGDFNQQQYINEYKRNAYKRVSIEIRKDDTEIIDKLNEVPNKKEYILDLIRKDIESNK